MESKDTAAEREKLMEAMLAAREDEMKKKKAKLGSGSGSSTMEPAAPEVRPAASDPAAAPIRRVLSLGVKSIFAFLSEAATLYPELCVKPMR